MKYLSKIQENKQQKTSKFSTQVVKKEETK